MGFMMEMSRRALQVTVQHVCAPCEPLGVRQRHAPTLRWQVPRPAARWRLPPPRGRATRIADQRASDAH
jgi:hypothetical protein